MKCASVMVMAGAVACGGSGWKAEQTPSRTAQGKLAQVCSGGATIEIDSAALDNPSVSLTGLYVTVQQDGTTLATGWTPFVASDLCVGAQYTITAADYRNYRFKRWEDGDATWIRRITAEPGAVYTAHYQVGGSIVPLYSWPVDINGDVTPDWNVIAAAHQRRPGIALIPVV
ncbi:MAG TPA: hypothetical protein VG496_04615, partial [Myxococcales bacterium]|nr:hypothetical protein [Myxococcales bacterium]